MGTNKNMHTMLEDVFSKEVIFERFDFLFGSGLIFLHPTDREKIGFSSQSGMEIAKKILWMEENEFLELKRNPSLWSLQ